jgi:hypothetical protein
VLKALCLLAGWSVVLLSVAVILWTIHGLLQPMRGGPPAWGLGEVLTTPLHKKQMLRITHVEMLPLERKQSEGKLLPHSDLWGGVFLEEVSCNRKRDRWRALVGTVRNFRVP